MRRLTRAIVEIESYKADALEGGYVWAGGNLLAVCLCNVALTALAQLEALAPHTAQTTPRIKEATAPDRVDVIIKQINDEIRDDYGNDDHSSTEAAA